MTTTTQTQTALDVEEAPNIQDMVMAIMIAVAITPQRITKIAPLLASPLGQPTLLEHRTLKAFMGFVNAVFTENPTCGLHDLMLALPMHRMFHALREDIHTLLEDAQYYHEHEPPIPDHVLMGYTRHIVYYYASFEAELILEAGKKEIARNRDQHPLKLQKILHTVGEKVEALKVGMESPHRDITDHYRSLDVGKHIMSLGLKPFDQVLGGGIRTGWSVMTYIVSGQGKTSLSIHCAAQAVRTGIQQAAAYPDAPPFRAVFWQTEMALSDTTWKLVTNLSGIPYDTVRLDAALRVIDTPGVSDVTVAEAFHVIGLHHPAIQPYLHDTNAAMRYALDHRDSWVPLGIQQTLDRTLEQLDTHLLLLGKPDSRQHLFDTTQALVVNEGASVIFLDHLNGVGTGDQGNAPYHEFLQKMAHDYIALCNRLKVGLFVTAQMNDESAKLAVKNKSETLIAGAGSKRVYEHFRYVFGGSRDINTKDRTILNEAKSPNSYKRKFAIRYDPTLFRFFDV